MLHMKGSDGLYLIPTRQTMLASGSNAGLGLSSYNMPSIYKEHHYLGNGDQVVSPPNTHSARVFAATMDQLRTFGSPGGYPGAPIVPAFGASQALAATNVAAGLRLTTQVSATTVNESVITFARNRSDTTGVGIPDASQAGMTAVDPMFPKPTEVKVLGPMGAFRLFGSDPNDDHFKTRTFSVADNVSWVYGKQRLRGGGFSRLAPEVRSCSRRLRISFWDCARRTT